MLRVSVVVVNWNGIADIGRCLESLSIQSYTDREIIVVDNASEDGSPELVASRFPEARLLRSPGNVGFAEGCNFGIREASGEYVATLNCDAWAESGWLGAMVNAVETDPSVGMVASRMLFAGDPATINSAGIMMDVLGIAWDRLGGSPSGTGDEPCEVFGPCAGAALYRRGLLEDVGLFDEGFFMYMEDVDLAWRARAAGWRCLYAPDARVYHRHSASAGEGSYLKNFLLGRNKVWTLAKNCTAHQALVYGVPMLLYDLFATAAGLRGAQMGALMGRLVAIAGIPGMLAKRRARRRLLGFGEIRPLLVGMESPRRVGERYKHLATLAR